MKIYDKDRKFAICNLQFAIFDQLSHPEFNNPKAQIEAKALPSKLADDYR